jgi:hypothetical protein
MGLQDFSRIYHACAFTVAGVFMRKTRKQSKQVYVTHEPLTAHQVLEKAAEILAESFKSGEQLNNPQSVKQYLSCN